MVLPGQTDRAACFRPASLFSSLRKEQNDDAWSVVNRCGSERKTCMSTIASGEAEAVLARPTAWSCCMSTVIGRSMCKND